MYRICDIFVFPNTNQTWGLAPLEAMVFKKPVIVSTGSGVSEVFNHTMKVDFWDIEDTANKIIAALQYKELHQEIIKVALC